MFFWNIYAMWIFYCWSGLFIFNNHLHRYVILLMPFFFVFFRIVWNTCMYVVCLVGCVFRVYLIRISYFFLYFFGFFVCFFEFLDIYLHVLVIISKICKFMAQISRIFMAIFRVYLTKFLEYFCQILDSNLLSFFKYVESCMQVSF